MNWGNEEYDRVVALRASGLTLTQCGIAMGDKFGPLSKDRMRMAIRKADEMHKARLMKLARSESVMYALYSMSGS